MNRPIVTVKQGKVQGIIQENVLGSHYLAFKGIPFAAPPVGELRFQDPKSPISWDGIRDASEDGNVSLQINPFIGMKIIGNEDCLYLNVYVPCNIHGTTSNPVMIWIHGGGFIFGSGTECDQRPDYLLTKDVIVVSVNYRLGALGFLNLDHEIASGNQGLKDQTAAIKWVKENIDVFGGDPENITVYGMSAGAVCVHLLTLSPLSKGLFHKAIIQSGLSSCFWAVGEKYPESNSFKLASILGNESKNPEEVFKFLQTISAAKIVEAQWQIPHDSRNFYLPFKPTIDKKAKRSFLPRPVRQLLNDDHDIPLILGHTSHEYIMHLEDTSKITLERIYENIPYYVEKFIGSSDPTKIMRLTERVKQWYFNDKPCTEDSIPFIIQFLSDIFYTLSIKELVNSRRKRKQAPTYFYTFSYIGSQITSTKLMEHTMPIGVSHCDDESYIFYKSKCKVNDPKPPAKGTKDRKVLETLTSILTTFAKTGNPTYVTDNNITITWPPATPDIFNCLEISDALQCANITDYTNIFQKFD